MRRVDPFSKRAAGLSLGLHMVVFVVAWVSALHRPPEIEFVTMQVDLVSPPAAQQADAERPPAEEVVVERPQPEPEPEPEADVVEPEPEPEPEPPPPEPEPTPPEPEPTPEPEAEETPAVTTEPEPEAETSGQDINVRIEGLRRDYPQYYANIVLQMRRCFQPRWRQGGSWETEVLFTIGRDGVATDFDFGKRSGNVAFDYTAMEAAECAGQGRFGPLPEDFPFPAVRINFTFEPPSDE